MKRSLLFLTLILAIVCSETRADWPQYLGPDRNGACWDSRRDVMWLFATRGWKEADGQVWKLDVDRWHVEAMHPANMETIGKAAFYLATPVGSVEGSLGFDSAPSERPNEHRCP